MAFGRALEALIKEAFGLCSFWQQTQTWMHDEGMRAADPARQSDRYAGTEGEGVVVGPHAANAVRATTRAPENQRNHGPHSVPSTWSDEFRCIAQSTAVARAS